MALTTGTGSKGAAAPDHLPVVRSRTLMKITTQFSHDCSAASAVEFSLLVLPFLFFVGILFQVCILGIEQAVLDNAAIQAIRTVNTGNVQSQNYSASTFQTQVICPLLLPTMSCSNISLNLYNTGGFSNDVAYASAMSLAQISTTGTYCPGSASTYEYLQLFYTSPFTLLNFSVFFGGSNTSQILMSTSVGINEPFSSVAGSC